MVFVPGSRKHPKKLFGREALEEKRFARQQWRAWIETPDWLAYRKAHYRFARQQWRAWIETGALPVGAITAGGFARQQWRAWIETTSSLPTITKVSGSPASNGGRGLKQKHRC